MTLRFLFWIFLLIIAYTYLAYTILLLFLTGIRRLVVRFPAYSEDYEPEVTLFVPAYNEIDCVEQKIRNSFQLDYPPDKIHFLWVTDGSDDGSPELLKQYKNVEVLHQKTRLGKINAMNRGIKYVRTPIVIFSDANTDLNKESIREIVRLFSDKRVGCVAGEKRIYSDDKEEAVSAGEGIYWLYESFIKRIESSIGSALGAVGELFAIRTHLYREVEEDTILDDFIISMRIAQDGNMIKYAPNAFASERASLSISEELKRKIRIATGGFQALMRIPELLNIFRYGLLSFQFFSHKVLRWALVPLAFIMVFITNLLIISLQTNPKDFYIIAFIIQIVFYAAAILGAVLKEHKTRLKLLFIPYYLIVMNYSIILGMIRFFTRKQTAIWEKARRG
ncbi:MAG: glycosyltransferase family 2 protein [Bacteroidales bacterium]|nr:glycosyltransferase family 2 protein [Bacteroidales bacterium]